MRLYGWEGEGVKGIISCHVDDERVRRGRVVTLPSWLLRYLIILKINTSPEATRSLCKEARNSEPTWGFRGFTRVALARLRHIYSKHFVSNWNFQHSTSASSLWSLWTFISNLKFLTQSTAAVWHHRESAYNVGIESKADESLCCDDFILFVFQNLILSCLIAWAFVKY